MCACPLKKPHNILVKSDRSLKICDFNMARGFNFDQDTAPTMSTFYMATRWYRAPEQLIESPVASRTSDMWACGCILAELINREVLFKGKTRVHQLQSTS